jgi:hypothetical protein
VEKRPYPYYAQEWHLPFTTNFNRIVKLLPYNQLTDAIIWKEN